MYNSEILFKLTCGWKAELFSPFVGLAIFFQMVSRAWASSDGFILSCRCWECQPFSAKCNVLSLGNTLRKIVWENAIYMYTYNMYWHSQHFCCWHGRLHIRVSYLSTGSRQVPYRKNLYGVWNLICFPGIVIVPLLVGMLAMHQSQLDMVGLINLQIGIIQISYVC